MEFCGMKREIDRKCLNHARVHANAQSFDRCGVATGVCSISCPLVDSRTESIDKSLNPSDKGRSFPAEAGKGMMTWLARERKDNL